MPTKKETSKPKKTIKVANVIKNERLEAAFGLDHPSQLISLMIKAERPDEEPMAAAEVGNQQKELE